MLGQIIFVCCMSMAIADPVKPAETAISSEVTGGCHTGGAAGEEPPEAEADCCDGDCLAQHAASDSASIDNNNTRQPLKDKLQLEFYPPECNDHLPLQALSCRETITAPDRHWAAHSTPLFLTHCSFLE